jgi:hypothetical protein
MSGLIFLLCSKVGFWGAVFGVTQHPGGTHGRPPGVPIATTNHAGCISARCRWQLFLAELFDLIQEVVWVVGS